MRYLIDTNIVIYLLAALNALSAEARRIVESEPDVSASIVSLWEIGINVLGEESTSCRYLPLP